MKTGFKYFLPEESETITGCSNALALITKEKIMIDSKFLPVLEAAERGDFFAQLEMQEAFASGTTGVPKHYNLARRYTDLIKDYNKGRIKPEIESLVNSAKLELDSGNVQSAKGELLEAAKIMINHLPSEDWNFLIFDYLATLSCSGDKPH